MGAASDASIWDSHRIDDSLLKLDADFFGAISGGRSFKALLKSLSFAARLAKVRGGENAILLCDPSITLGIGTDQQLDDALSEFELEVSELDVRQQLADRFAYWALSRDVRANQFSRKVRCFADFRNDAYFTQHSQTFHVDLLGG